MKNILITLLFFPLIGSDLSESHKRSFGQMSGAVNVDLEAVSISDILDHVGPLDKGIFNHDVGFDALLGIGDQDIISYPLDTDCWIDSINQQPLDLGVVHTAAKKQKQRAKKSCPECGCSVCNLKTHMRTHAGEKPYKCEYPGCDYAARYLSHIQDHARTHTREKPFKCNHPGCGYASAKLSHIKVHERIHTGEKPYKCEYPGCDYAAIVKQNLIYHHMRIHTGEKPYKCEYPGCSYASVSSCKLQIHARTHTGEKSYHCEYPGCDYAAACKHTLRIHIKIYNKVSCLICNKIVSDLRAHFKTKKHQRNIAE